MHAARQMDQTVGWRDGAKAGLEKGSIKRESILVYSSYNIYSQQPNYFFQKKDEYPSTKLLNLATLYHSPVCH